jgi:hypothetical protein
MPMKGPVPEFKKIRAPTDLRPKVTSQPLFRRANPEGGFISVSNAIPCFPLDDGGDSSSTIFANCRCSLSLYKLLLFIYQLLTVSATLISNTSPREILAESLRNLARELRMTVMITRRVTTSSMSTIYWDLKRQGTSKSIDTSGIPGY